MTRPTHYLIVTTRKPPYHTTRATGCGRTTHGLALTFHTKQVNCIVCRRHLRRLARVAAKKEGA
jgi:hypothetical protein